MIEDLRKAVETMEKGGVILYPTDTVWGIGCDTANAEAVARIFRIKQREDSKSMLVLAADMEQLEGIVAEVPDPVRGLLAEADRPTTVIYPGARNIAPNLIAGDGSVGIRIPDAEFPRMLCRMLGRPVVSTSANISGMPTPADFAGISEEIRKSVDYVCTTGRSGQPSTPSSIYILRDGEIKQLR